ncbi:TonB-dependent receptor domain-containing protein [Chryseobacterium sp. SIMBA_038]|uniref:TonB-dependent receptor domain-containing protein n=1 Tax=Chryseobacterium sp. SIMBA_038 TaxID=3085780 RepID=UPI00397E35F7
MKKTIFTISFLSSIISYAQEKSNDQIKEKKIEGVTITKTKKAVEQKADRTIFDFSEQSYLNNGNLLEGIKKLPGLISTDASGIMYRGKALDVYINGRPLNITSNDLTSFLEGMPANSVDRIEVITQPGAEFPATSGGAIMNIITNKNANKYLTATYSGNYSFTNNDKIRSKTNNSLNLNARNKIFGWQLNVGESYNESLQNSEQDELLKTNSNRFARGYFARSGVNFDLGKDKLLLNYDIYYNNNDTYTLSNGYGNLPYKNNFNDLREAFYNSSDAARANNLRQEAVVTYQKRFSDKSQKLDFQFGYSDVNNKFSQDNYFEKNYFVLTNEEINNAGQKDVLSNSSNMRIANFKVDYSQPLKIFDGGKVSFGGLYEKQNFDTKSRGLTNLEYQRQTASTYLQFQASLKKFDFIAGTRAENYDISGIVRTLDSNNAIIERDLRTFNKFKLFPNASIQYNLTDRINFAANYNKKINLPGISALNPNNSILGNPNVQIGGNPDLQPSIFDNYELSFSAFDYISASYNISTAKNKTTQIIRREGNNLYYEQINIPSMKMYNYNLSFPIPLTIFSKPMSEVMKFDFNPDKTNILYFFASYQKHDIDDLKNKGLWIFNVTGNFILPKDIKLNANYTYITPNGGFFYLTAEKPFANSFDLTLSKKFMNKRLTVSVFANDIFNGQQNMAMSYTVPNGGEKVIIKSASDSRRFGISVNYKIPTKNKLAKEDPNILNSMKKEENGDLIQRPQ